MTFLPRNEQIEVNQMGQAYGFFSCNATKDMIEAQLPAIRKLTQTPSDLELWLTESIDNPELPEDLLPIAQEAAGEGLRYVLQATYSKATNEKTADYLVNLLNQTYQSPLYQEGETFEGGIVYKGDNNKYVFRD